MIKRANEVLNYECDINFKIIRTTIRTVGMEINPPVCGSPGRLIDLNTNKPLPGGIFNLIVHLEHSLLVV